MLALALSLPVLSSTQTGPLLVRVTTSPNPYALEGTSSVANSNAVLGYATGAKSVALQGYVTQPQSAGLEGFSSSSSGTISDGVFGDSQNGFGVFGIGTNAGYSGVFGSNASAGGIGVLGKAPASGVFGETTAATGTTAQIYGGVLGEDASIDGAQSGVLGSSPNGSGVIGVYGLPAGTVPTDATMLTRNGVFGYDAFSGRREGSAGVFGATVGSYGVWGQVRGSDGVGVLADSGGTPGSVALQAESRLAGDDAIQTFDSSGGESLSLDSSGNLIVEGSITQMGTPQVAVRGASGARRVMYAPQTTQSTLEDFGRATMTNGRATVALDPGFADLLADANYLVFVTPRGPAPVYVTAQSSRGFEVVAMSGRPSMDVDYRIVGQPRRQRPEPRLAVLHAHLLSAKPRPDGRRIANGAFDGRPSLSVMPHGAPLPTIVRPGTRP